MTPNLTTPKGKDFQTFILSIVLDSESISLFFWQRSKYERTFQSSWIKFFLKKNIKKKIKKKSRPKYKHNDDKFWKEFSVEWIHLRTQQMVRNFTRSGDVSVYFFALFSLNCYQFSNILWISFIFNSFIYLFLDVIKSTEINI